MALYAFDGTWQRDQDNPVEDTNVVWFRDAYDGPVEYFPGPGTRLGWLGRLVGGLTGAGGRWRVRQALKALERHCAQGDHIIDVVGFSRGAALALHFANAAGHRRIRFLGLFDTVPCFGIPANRIDLGWDLGLAASVERCFHAMALHEQRLSFPLLRLAPDVRVQEVWFRGVHSDIGGGNGNCGLSSIPLDWMFAEAHRCGVKLKTWKVIENRARMNAAAPVSAVKLDTKLRRRTPRPGDRFHASLRPAA
jgi:uncharacterized protein (DUF2235 family)